jgi:hypothetical protein
MKDMKIIGDKTNGLITGWLNFVMIVVPVMIMFVTSGRCC